VADLSGNHLATPYSWSFGVAPWTLHLGTSGADEAGAFTIDASGNRYVAGTTTGSPDGTTNSGGVNVVIVKYNSAGVKQWTRLLGLSTNEGPDVITTDSAGNVYVGGWVEMLIPQTAGVTSQNAFIVKYDSTGQQQWVKQIATGQGDMVRGLATDTAGNVMAVGYTAGNLSGLSAGGPDLFIVKYNSAGTELWSRQLGTTATDNAVSVATDSTGNIYVTGYSFGSLDGNTSAGSGDLVLLKLDSTGSKVWTHQMGTTGFDSGSGITLDSAGNIYVVGRTEGSLDGNPNNGGLDIYIAKFDNAGVNQWFRQFGSSSDEYATGIALDPYGNIVVSGYTAGGIDSSAHVNPAGMDAFVAKYSAAGSKLWIQQTGAGMTNMAYGIGVDAAANVYVSISSTGDFDGNPSFGGSDIFVVKYQLDGTKR
jgi:hypothetical protein